MAQERPGEHQGQPESAGRPEILDFENHGAVYGRFLLASLPEAKIHNIIDPTNKTVEFDNLTPDTLEKRNYNPVVENFSFAERKKQWEGVEYSEAYSQWRTKFMESMHTIAGGSNRELALRAILANNKESKDFTVNDADALFNEFCKGGSDINNFTTRVTTNLDRNGKIDPKELTELVPHLKWIASGLFGKDTASQVVTRLIELESAIHNNPKQVIEFFNSNTERINNLKDDEKKILGLLHGSFPVPQESTTVPAEPAAQPVQEQPASVVASATEPATEIEEMDAARLLASGSEPVTAELIQEIVKVSEARAQEILNQLESEGILVKKQTTQDVSPIPTPQPAPVTREPDRDQVASRIVSVLPRAASAIPEPDEIKAGKDEVEQTPKSAPVTEEPVIRPSTSEVEPSGSDKPPLPPPTGGSPQPESPVVRSIETVASTQERSGNTAARIQNLLSQLDTLEKSPTNIGEYTKRYIDDQKKTINAQIKGLEKIDELKIQIGNLEQIDTSKFGEYTKQDIALQVEGLKQELANLQAKYALPTEIVPQPDASERPVGEINDQEMNPAARPVVAELKVSEEEPIPGLVVTPIEGEDSDYKLQIKINGKDTGFKWREQENGVYVWKGNQLVDPDKFPESLDLPEGTTIEIEFAVENVGWRTFAIRAGKNTKIPLSKKVNNIWLYRETSNYTFMRQWHPGEIYEFGRSANLSFDDFAKLLAETQPASPVPNVTEIVSSSVVPKAPAETERIESAVPAEEEPEQDEFDLKNNPYSKDNKDTAIEEFTKYLTSQGVNLER